MEDGIVIKTTNEFSKGGSIKIKSDEITLDTLSALGENTFAISGSFSLEQTGNAARAESSSSEKTQKASLATTWSSTTGAVLKEEYFGRIVEVRDTELFVELLLDKEKKKFVTKKFPKDLFSGMVSRLYQGKLLAIQFLVRPNELITKAIENVEDRISLQDFKTNAVADIVKQIDYSRYNKKK